MRKIISVFFVIASVFLLFGCQDTSVPAGTYGETNPATTTTHPTEVTVGQQESLQLPMYTISLPRTTEATTVGDGKIVFRYVYQNISLILPEAEVADRVILDFLNQQDAVSAYAKTAAETAKQSFSNDSQWTPHLLQMLYAPMRLDSGVLSLYGDKVSYTGAAHSVYSGQSLNYDLLTGNRLFLTDIIRNDITTDVLTQQISNTLASLVEEKHLFPSYEGMLSQLIPADLSLYTNWYFSNQGLCFYFTPGEIAPYATGTVVAEIPYDQLTRIMEDAYFPTEIVPESAVINAQLFDSADHAGFSRFSELILQKDAQRILLHADATVYDVKIYEVIASTGITEASGNPVLYAAHTLSANDAILIEADFSAVLLMLTCYTEDGFQLFTITVNDDSVSLNKI